jgi:hypothetical protein
VQFKFKFAGALLELRSMCAAELKRRAVVAFTQLAANLGYLFENTCIGIWLHGKEVSTYVKVQLFAVSFRYVKVPLTEHVV